MKKNAIAGPRFDLLLSEPLDRRLAVVPCEAMASLMGRPPFRQVREVVRRVQATGSVDLDTTTTQRALAADSD